jgi:Rho family protein
LLRGQANRLTEHQVDSPQSLENIETKWKDEIQENCPGVKIVLVALKCDLREADEDEVEDPDDPKRPLIEYAQGLETAQNIKALRYLGTLRERASDVIILLLTKVTECSALMNRGVREGFIEAARVALSHKNSDDSRFPCSVM